MSMSALRPLGGKLLQVTAQRNIKLANPILPESRAKNYFFALDALTSEEDALVCKNRRLD